MTVLTDQLVTITGTASDAGSGLVARVEVSVDGGSTYSAATGTTSGAEIYKKAKESPPLPALSITNK